MLTGAWLFRDAEFPSLERCGALPLQNSSFERVNWADKWAQNLLLKMFGWKGSLTRVKPCLNAGQPRKQSCAFVLQPALTGSSSQSP